jgi:hypothetical protein
MRYVERAVRSVLAGVAFAAPTVVWVVLSSGS